MLAMDAVEIELLEIGLGRWREWTAEVECQDPPVDQR
jgi:hypothetical protein